jgi:protein-S-isoprenylcysteine O-methyltransferase Ste14
METQLPFRAIRRPIELGAMITVTGLCWLRPAPSIWICLGTWIVLWNGILELGDWELRHRLPGCRDYLRRTPRYLPRRLIFRRRLAHSG